MNIGDLIPRDQKRNAVATRGTGDGFSALQDQIDRLFDDFSRGFGMARSDTGASWPSIEVREDDQKFCVEAELPGMDEKDVEVVLTDNVLTIRGERQAEQSDAKQHWSERYFGAFQRQIQLSADVDRDKVRASFKQGVLRVEIPKAPEAQQRARKIPVSS